MKSDNPARRPLMTMAGAGPTTLHLPPNQRGPARGRAVAAARAACGLFAPFWIAPFETDAFAVMLATHCGWGRNGDAVRAVQRWRAGVWVPVDRKAFEAFLMLLALAGRA
jgi:hypothetical protein